MDATGIAAAAALLAIGAVCFWQTRHRSTAKVKCSPGVSPDMLNPSDGLERMEKAISELIAELKENAQRNIQELAGWAAQLNELIRAADQRVSLLRSLQQIEAPQADEPAAAAEPEMRVEQPSALLADSSPLALAEAARRLLEETDDESEIARRLGISRGEVRLLFAMRQKEVGSRSL
jgi:hypothetical protein